jgi:hypothetical protein
MKKLFAFSLTVAVYGLLIAPLGSAPHASSRGLLTRQPLKDQSGVNGGALPCPSCAQEVEQTIYAPLVRLAESSGTEINLNCRSPHAVEVTPTFYTAAGQAFAGEAFEMQPAQVKTVNLQTLMPRAVRNRRDMGGMTLSYTGHALEMWGQLRLLNVGGGNSVDVLFSNLPDRRSNVRNAVWAVPADHAAAVVAVGNAGGGAARAVLEFSDGDRQEVEVPAFGTELIRRRYQQHGRDSGAARADGVTITSAEGGNLIFTGAVVSDDHGFASSIRFYDTENVAQQNLFATNFRALRVKATMVLRNTGAQSVVATPRFRPVNGDADSFIDLAAVTLAPGGIETVDLAALADAAKTRPEFAAVSAEVVNTGPKGSLIGALNGVDEVTGLTYDVPLRDIGGVRLSTGAYPWRLDGDFSTVVSITNVAPAPSEFVVQINYAGGHYLLDPRKLDAGATARFDLRKIRDEQVPDRDGHTIPRSVEGGQFRWFIHGAGSGRLIGRAEMLSVSRGVSSSYSCNMPCPPSFDHAQLDPNPTEVGVGETGTQEAQEVDVDGYGNEYGPFAASVVSWWSWDTAVATVDYGQVTGLTEGETTATVTVEYPLYMWDGSNTECSVFDTRQANANGQVQVDATITISAVSFNPNRVPRNNGTTTLVVEMAASPGVPSNEQVSVEVFQNTNPNQAVLTLQAGSQNPKTASVDGTTGGRAEFQFHTPGNSLEPSPVGTVTWRARIIDWQPRQVTDGNGRTITIKAKPDDVISTPVCVGSTFNGGNCQ